MYYVNSAWIIAHLCFKYFVYLNCYFIIKLWTHSDIFSLYILSGLSSSRPVILSHPPQSMLLTYIL